MPFVSTKPLNKLVLAQGGRANKRMDLGWLEYYGGQGGGGYLRYGRSLIQSSQSTVMVRGFFFRILVRSLLIMLFVY